MDNLEPKKLALIRILQIFEKYSDFDNLGRCGVAIASCGKDTMPTGPRESISNVKPTGWIQATYDFISTGFPDVFYFLSNLFKSFNLASISLISLIVLLLAF